MKSPRKYLLAPLLCLWSLAAPLLTTAAEPEGEWLPPALDGSGWKHDGTKLAFPGQLGGYRFAGHFNYKDGGTLLRYENLEEQARLDLFLFKLAAPLTSQEDKHRRILTEMDTLARDMQAMAKEGRYKNLVIGDPTGTELELWQKQALPMASRTINAVRLGSSDKGADEAEVRQWVGITVMDEYLLTIRHMRPAATGDAGEQGMKQVVGLVFQVLKDPSLRSHIHQFVKEYLANPFSPEADQAAAAVMAYLNNTPYFPISIPESPISGWLEHCGKVAPGTQDHLLKAFLLGSADKALEGGNAAQCLNSGSKQFATVYRQLVKNHPDISRPDLESFVAASEKDSGYEWLKTQGYLRQ